VHLPAFHDAARNILGDACLTGLAQCAVRHNWEAVTCEDVDLHFLGIKCGLFFAAGTIESYTLMVLDISNAFQHLATMGTNQIHHRQKKMMTVTTMPTTVVRRGDCVRGGCLP